MDNYSFLNTAHTAYFAELYDQYLQHPDSVEPSGGHSFKALTLAWKAIVLLI